jgi:hypothetical protein
MVYHIYTALVCKVGKESVSFLRSKKHAQEVQRRIRMHPAHTRRKLRDDLVARQRFGHTAQAVVIQSIDIC